MRHLLTTLAFLTFALTAYGQKAPSEVKLTRGVDPTSVDGIKSAGVFTGEGYENRVLGLSITAPAGFKKVDDKTNQETLQTGREMTKAGKSAATIRELDRSVSNTRVLFQYHASGASLACGIEAVPAGVTDRQYAEANIAVLKGVSQAKLKGGISVRNVAGRDWQVFETELTTPEGGIVSQVYLMRVVGRNALFFVGSIGDPLLADAVVASLNSLTFK